MLIRLLMFLCLSVAPALAQQKVLRVVPSADLRVLDPQYSVVITRIHAMMIYDTLFSWDSKQQPRPQMVESHTTSDDGLLWRFTLRPGLRFHDGQDLTTADVVASLRRWMARDIVGTKLASYIATMEADDPRTFSIRLSRPAPFMLFALGSAIGRVPFILRASDAATDAGTPITTTIGSGPFRFNREQWLSGQRVVYDRNPDYTPRSEPPDGLAGGHVVKVDRVEWHVMPDPSTAAAALQAGEVDMWEQASADLLPVLERNRNVVVDRAAPLPNQGLLRPNGLLPPFNDPRARLALAYLVDQRDAMAAGVGDEKWWRACESYYICGGPLGTIAGTDGYAKPDRERARQLLAESGYKGEKIVFITTNEIPWMGRMAEVVADGLRSIGANVDLQYADWGTVVTRLPNQGPTDKGGWNLFVTGSSGTTMAHPLTNLATDMSCRRTNFSGWVCDEEVERLRQTFLDAPDAGRQAALEALHRRLAEVQPYRILGQWDIPYARRTSVTGVLPAAVMVYWNIDKQ